MFTMMLASALACSVAMPASCTSTDAFVAAPGVEQRVRRFLGDRRDDLFVRNRTVAEQALAAFSGIPDAQQAGRGFELIFSACRTRSCSEKAAMVVARDGRILAIGMLHSTCATPRAPANCAQDRRLTIYAPRDAQPLYSESLAWWAGNVLRADGGELRSVDHVEV